MGTLHYMYYNTCMGPDTAYINTGNYKYGHIHSIYRLHSQTWYIKRSLSHIKTFAENPKRVDGHAHEKKHTVHKTFAEKPKIYSVSYIFLIL